jgi:hypothetical protein
MAAIAAPATSPVCSTCADTHRMPLGDGTAMCTRCPVPCDHCRAGGTGPYCTATPCACACHRQPAIARARDLHLAQRFVAARATDGAGLVVHHVLAIEVLPDGGVAWEARGVVTAAQMEEQRECEREAGAK